MSVVADIKSSFTYRVDRVRDQLKDTVVKTGLPLDGVDERFTECEKRLDPLDGSSSLFCFWRDPKGKLLGSLQVHETGRVYAEYDVVVAHPQKKGWFIESVTAWGDDNILRSELQLLKMPE